ncbi:MAG: hypothetical protein QOG21_384 [Actinomycetota bacterium]|jgi:hypothetical protein|nr:hypothetical protein [Actinomycetota bacterium]
MQAQRRSRVVPIIKRVAIAFAVKKGIDMFQESRRPKKPSLIGRLAKLGMWAAGGGGLFYAFVSGKLQPLVDKVMDASSSSDESDRWTSPSTISTGTQASSSTPSPSASTDGNLSNSPSSTSV